jgi:YidC/Oxa1 family membrane protein insertase
MQNRNFILFLTLSMATLIAWNTFVLPRIAPQKKPPAAQNVAKKDAVANAAKPGSEKATDQSPKPDAQAAVSAKPADKKGDEKANKAGANKAGAPGAKPAEAIAAKGAAGKIPEFARKTIVLGSSDPDTGYCLEVETTSRGAAVSGIEFNDPRYREIAHPKVPLKLVGNDINERIAKAIRDRDFAQAEQRIAAEKLQAAQAAARPGEVTADIESDRTALQAADERLRQADRDVSLAQTTFNTDVPEFNALFPKDSGGVSARDWDVAQVTPDPVHPGVNKAVTFRYPTPDGQLIVEKRYSLEPVQGAEGSSRAAREVRDTVDTGYLVHLDITLTNAGKGQRTVTYTLQGPVGLPLEDAANARKFRDLKLGFLQPTGAINAQTKTASQVLADEEKNKIEEWKSPIKYIGVDVQYFAALVLPTDDQLKNQTIERTVPMLLATPTDKSLTDLSVQFDSTKVALAGKDSVTHHFELFAGPKRRTLLTPLQAEAVLDFGWFGQISNGMLWVLNIFHRMGLSYGVAIICLTVVVRALMFPVSLRQTAQAQRMKDMQPKLAELKKKYADNKEKLAMANLELMREYKVNPMAGCLPLLIQMPIFIALYQALQYSVDLRLAPFLWFNNLAAPDALFKLPFQLPWPLYWTTFNLLPIITVALMVVQQKMFMPPAADEQQEMQQKMMSYMMVVMGAMFYKFPSGLCVYYISSSLWGFGERKLLTWWKPSIAAPPGAAPAVTQQPAAAGRGKPTRAADAEPVGGVRGAAGSFWQKLLNAADAANSDAATGSKSAVSRRKEHSGGKRNGKRPR